MTCVFWQMEAMALVDVGVRVPWMAGLVPVRISCGGYRWRALNMFVRSDNKNDAFCAFVVSVIICILDVGPATSTVQY